MRVRGIRGKPPRAFFDSREPRARHGDCVQALRHLWSRRHLGHSEYFAIARVSGNRNTGGEKERNNESVTPPRDVIQFR
ncbi:hypothetical protein PUN28_013197 [Cardiocondyla obscurior]|uniref:Uncharacterized protein n=1 Tax=Cardiocondyla obscurior TaxID=286306 RepID=A0AAW2F9W8_9HYME